MEFVTSGFSFAYFIFRHIFRMMYWVWVPGFILSALICLRYRGASFRALAQVKPGGLRALGRAILLGITCTPDRRRSRGLLTRLMKEGYSPGVSFAALVASRNLPLYLLTLVMVLLGMEFALGQVIGAVAMAGFVGLTLNFARGKGEVLAQSNESVEDGEEFGTWRELIFTGRGWWAVTRYFGREFRGFGANLVLGIILGGFILVAGLQSWWPELARVGGGGAVSEVLSAMVAPFIAIVAYLSPVGSLAVVSSLFKADALAYTGLVSFILASAIKPRDIAGYVKSFGPARGVASAAILYGGAVFGGLVATGVFALFGFRPGHVPLFRELVDKIIMLVPFAMPKMPGM